jgi:membrane protease YdiL (CAAX protease family)
LRLGIWVGGTVASASAALVLVGSLVARQFGLQLGDVTPAATVAWDQLLWRAVLLLWVDTAIPEELGFRGALMCALGGLRGAVLPADALSVRRVWSTIGAIALQPAVLLSSLAFAAWHVVVVLQDGTPDPLTIAAKLMLIAAGGVLFAALRIISGNLLAPIVGHWLIDMLAMLSARLAVVL